MQKMFFERVLLQQSSARELLRGEATEPEPHELITEVQSKVAAMGIAVLFLMHRLLGAETC